MFWKNFSKNVKKGWISNNFSRSSKEMVKKYEGIKISKIKILLTF